MSKASLNGYAGHGRHAPDISLDTLSSMGCAGTGKGTSIEFIMKELAAASRAAVHMEAGNIVRNHIRQGTQFGLLAKDYSSRGLLVPDEYIVPQLSNAVRQLPSDAFWNVDGFPRNEDQIQAYEELMATLGRNDMIMYLSLSDDPKTARAIAEERMRKRGEMAILAGLTPRKDDIDPATRAQRLDEADKLIPVIDHFRQRDRVIVIDSTQDIAGVQSQIREKVLARILPADIPLIAAGSQPQPEALRG